MQRNTPLNINFTEKLVENLHESQNSWKIVEKNFSDFYQQHQYIESIKKTREQTTQSEIKNKLNPKSLNDEGNDAALAQDVQSKNPINESENVVENL